MILLNKTREVSTHLLLELVADSVLSTEKPRRVQRRAGKMKQRIEIFALYRNTQEPNRFLCQGEYKRVICLAKQCFNSSALQKIKM